MGGVLDDAEAVVGKGPEDHRGAEHARLAQDMDIQDMADTDQHKGENLAAQAVSSASVRYITARRQMSIVFRKQIFCFRISTP